MLQQDTINFINTPTMYKTDTINKEYLLPLQCNKAITLAQWFTSKTPLQRFFLRRLRDTVCLAILYTFIKIPLYLISIVRSKV